MAPKTDRQKMTPPQIARLWGISPDKVVAWIKAGELPAIDGATRANGKRPRYLIDVADLGEFERRRSTSVDEIGDRSDRS